MRTPLDRELGPHHPLPYAPKRWRDVASAEPRGTASSFQALIEDPEPCRSSVTAASTADDGVHIECHLPRSPEPTLVSEAWPASRRGSKFGAFVCFTLAIAVAAIAAPLIAPSAGSVAVASDLRGEPSFQSQLVQGPNVAERPRPPSTELIVDQETAQALRNQDQAFPLAVTVAGSVAGASVVVDGLATGSTLTIGAPLGTHSWRLAATDLRNAQIRPPKGFVGPMDVVVELRLADDSLADRKSLRLEWAATGARQSTGYPIRQLDPGEIADLLRRGNELIVSGDLASARLVLQRAAEAGDPGAAMMLAGTYDPIMLEKVGIQAFARDLVEGFAPDIGLARTWYERARDLGSMAAIRRLEMLASRGYRAVPQE